LRKTYNYRTVRTVVAALALVVIAGCGVPSLENVGERSGEWIGPLTNGATFVPSEPHPMMVMVSP
jgi:hypothetical protein